MGLQILHNLSKSLPRTKPSGDYADSIVVKTVPLIGRIHIVNDRNGLLQVGFVVAYWVYGTFSTLYIILLPQYNDGNISVNIIISFMFVSVMCMLSLIKASLTNPGRIPLINNESVFDVSEWTFCKTCNRKRPKRAHHCRRCGQCVIRMDHHCPWINNCVGAENHFAFHLLLFYAFLLGAFALTLTVFHFWIWPKCHTCHKEVFYIKHSIWFIYVLVILAFNMMLLMFLQLANQHFNLLIGRTTLENMQSPPGPDDIKFRHVYSAYRELCGQGTVLCWLWPCRQRVAVLQSTVSSPV